MNQFKQIRFSDMKIAKNRKVTLTEKKLRKKTFTTASPHDITEKSNLVIGGRQSCLKSRASGIYYDVLDTDKIHKNLKKLLPIIGLILQKT